MVLSEEDYFQKLRQLLPPGPAFDFELQPDVAALMASLAPELARIDGQDATLLLELNPATTTALLPDWEAYLGLPDACTVAGSQTLEERRQAVLDKLTATGAPQLSYYQRIAQRLGIVINIEEFRPARVGSAAVGDFLYGDGWPWSWIASAPLASYGTVEAATLDCRLQLEAPEYTDVQLGFGRAQVDAIALSVDTLFHAIHYVMPAAIAGLEDL